MVDEVYHLLDWQDSRRPGRMAMIMEQAGGAASTGTCRILDVQPKDIHERIPTFIGSIENVYELDQFFEYYGSDEMESPEK